MIIIFLSLTYFTYHYPQLLFSHRYEDEGHCGQPEPAPPPIPEWSVPKEGGPARCPRGGWPLGRGCCACSQYYRHHIPGAHLCSRPSCSAGVPARDRGLEGGPRAVGQVPAGGPRSEVAALSRPQTRAAADAGADPVGPGRRLLGAFSREESLLWCYPGILSSFHTPRTYSRTAVMDA